MSTDTVFKAEVRDAHVDAFGAENVQADVRIDAKTGEILDGQHSLPRSRQGVLPTFEGLVVSAFEVSFGGKVELSEFETDMAVRNTLRLGQRVRLVVEGTVVAVPHTFKEAGKRGEDDTVTRGARVAVDQVSLE